MWRARILHRRPAMCVPGWRLPGHEPAKLGWPVVARPDHRAGSDAVPANREGVRAMDTTKLLRRLTTTAVAAAVAVVAMSPSVKPVAVGVGYHDPAPGGAALDKAAATAI